MSFRGVLVRHDYINDGIHVLREELGLGRDAARRGVNNKETVLIALLHLVKERDHHIGREKLRGVSGGFPAGSMDSLSMPLFSMNSSILRPPTRYSCRPFTLPVSEHSVHSRPPQVSVDGQNEVVNAQGESSREVGCHISFSLRRKRAGHKHGSRDLAILGEKDLASEHLEGLGIRRVGRRA